MAGDWIKMRSNLQTHPKVARIASASNADRLRVVGGLHAVWCLFDEHSADGHLCGYTPSAVDSLIGWPGFTELLIGVGWLQSDGNDGLSLPEFDAHNGASSKRRAQENDRKKAERAAVKEHPQPVRNLSASNADASVTREEKRREEKKEGDTRKRAPSVLRPEEVTEQTWNDWLLLRKTKRAPVTETVLSGAREESKKASLTLEAFLRVWCTRGSQGLQADWLKPEERGQRAAQPARQHDTAEDTRRMLAERDRQAAPAPAAVREQLHALTSRFAGKAPA